LKSGISRSDESLRIPRPRPRPGGISPEGVRFLLVAEKKHSYSQASGQSCAEELGNTDVYFGLTTTSHTRRIMRSFYRSQVAADLPLSTRNTSTSVRPAFPNFQPPAKKAGSQWVYTKCHRHANGGRTDMARRIKKPLGLTLGMSSYVYFAPDEQLPLHNPISQCISILF
jgi:hypothetical protein